MLEQDRIYQIALTKVKGIGPVMSKLLISHCGSATAVFQEQKKALLKIPGIHSKIASSLFDAKVFAEAETEFKLTQKHKVQILYFHDKEYPLRLKQYQDSPLVLYYKGQADLQAERTVAIVGTRLPSNYGKAITEQLVAQLKEYQVQIISGLAHGIDAKAHRSSLQYGLPTIGVMGGGFEKIYPANNRALAHDMLACGGLLTEFCYKDIPDREHFPMRNRIIAALADAVVVIESGRKGGSIITADLANQYHKDVFAVPGKLNDDKSIGCNALIKQHRANLIESAKDISYIMGWSGAEKEVQLTLPLVELNDEQERIVKLLRKETKLHFDSILRALDIPLTRLSPVLLELEFMGQIKTLPGKSYMLG